MATDYDAPRNRPEDDDNVISLEGVRASRAEQAAAVATLDDNDPSELSLDLPGADLSEEDLTLSVLPQQADEFTCTSCWLVHHRSHRPYPSATVCLDCAA